MPSEKRPIPLGVDDFKEIREYNYLYIDKSLLIKEILSSGSKVTLFTRPRRFGKTLNMSTLKYFLDCNTLSSKALFEGLKIETEKNGKYVLEHMNKYPVFFITLKNLEFVNYESFSRKLNQRLAREFEKYKYLLDSERVSKAQKERFNRILFEQATAVDLTVSLQFICDVFKAHHGVDAFLLIDEYDAPIHSAFQYGQYEECISFMKSLYADSLKGNESLRKAIMTGILRVAKESIFSGLNNLDTLTVLSSDCSNYFGITEAELKDLLLEYELEEKFEQVKYWYNGYQFGERSSIYNPWSILSWLRNSLHQFQAYWVNTSSNDLVQSLFLEHKDELYKDIFKMLSGENIQMQLSENLHFSSLKVNCSNADYFTLLFHSGYLTAESINKNNDENEFYRLMIPNREIQFVFRKILGDWLNQYAPKLNDNISLHILEALTKGDTKSFEKHFSEVVLQVMSYHDFSNQPENAFHCFTAGFLSWLSHEYEVKSNRETGEGRADIWLIPRNIKLPGYIFELKAYKPRKKLKAIPVATIKNKLNLALRQIEERNYEAEFKARKIKKVIKIALVFYKKKVWFKE